MLTFPVSAGRAGAEQPSAAVTPPQPSSASQQPNYPLSPAKQLQKHSLLTMPLSINSFSSCVPLGVLDEAKLGMLSAKYAEDNEPRGERGSS